MRQLVRRVGVSALRVLAISWIIIVALVGIGQRKLRWAVL